MGARIKLLEDLKAADIGLDHTLGLLALKGTVLENVIAPVAAKLIRAGKAELVSDDRGIIRRTIEEQTVKAADIAKRADGGDDDKRARPQVENKSARKGKAPKGKAPKGKAPKGKRR